MLLMCRCDRLIGFREVQPVSHQLANLSASQEDNFRSLNGFSGTCEAIERTTRLIEGAGFAIRQRIA